MAGVIVREEFRDHLMSDATPESDVEVVNLGSVKASADDVAAGLEVVRVHQADQRPMSC